MLPTLLTATRSNVPGLHFRRLTEDWNETNGASTIRVISGTTVTGMEAPIGIALGATTHASCPQRHQKWFAGHQLVIFQPHL
ncbi:MAG: hypothetical protein H7A20_01745 [Rhodanobacteraceae bacterium]|nr:hypothetical protein [Rhodanobacteraceae bacterium]